MTLIDDVLPTVKAKELALKRKRLPKPRAGAAEGAEKKALLQSS